MKYLRLLFFMMVLELEIRTPIQNALAASFSPDGFNQLIPVSEQVPGADTVEAEPEIPSEASLDPNDMTSGGGGLPHARASIRNRRMPVWMEVTEPIFPFQETLPIPAASVLDHAA